MRILFFSSMRGDPWGGSEHLWRAAAIEAIAAGHQIALSLYDWGDSLHAHVRELAQHGAKRLLRPRDQSKLLDLIRRPDWLREIERFSPDCICLSQGGAYELAGSGRVRPFARWLDRTNVPVVNVMQYNDDRSDLRPSVIARVKRLNALASANAFVSQRNIDQAARAMLGPIPRAVVVRNPVNLADVTPLPWPARANANANAPAQLASVARLHLATKGHDLLFEALASEPLRSQAWHLTLYGQGPDEAAIRKRPIELGIGERVTFAGQVNDLRAVWRSHEVLVMPSRAEGTPIALIEAMLLGRPVMATDVGGCAEWIDDGASGWLARQPDPNDVATALGRCFADRTKWKSMGQRAAQTAAKLHDPHAGRTLLEMLTIAHKQGRPSETFALCDADRTRLVKPNMSARRA